MLPDKRRSTKKVIIINIIKNQDPSSLSAILQPFMNKLIYIGLGILPASDFHSVCNLPKTLLETSYVASMDPKNPRFWGVFPDSMRVFHGKLRLPFRCQQLYSAFLGALFSPHAAEAHQCDSRCRCQTFLVNQVK
jgi:hypothetical protein